MTLSKVACNDLFRRQLCSSSTMNTDVRLTVSCISATVKQPEQMEDFSPESTWPLYSMPLVG